MENSKVKIIGDICFVLIVLIITVGIVVYHTNPNVINYKLEQEKLIYKK